MDFFTSATSLDAAGSTSAVLSGSGGRKQSFAALACETCRGRKSRCDERRPRCSVCERLDVACEYRDPKPTKQDQTLKYILKNLTNIERKIDRLVPSESRRAVRSPETAPNSFTVPAQKSTEIQRILTWPEVRRSLRIDHSTSPYWIGIDENAEQWLCRISENFHQDESLEERLDLHHTVGKTLEDSSETTFLNRRFVETMCTIYFQTFHTIYPIIDSQSFTKTVVPRVCNNSFQEKDEGSTLVLLVVALGILAYERPTGDLGIYGDGQHYAERIFEHNNSSPPGIALLNEARRRMGFIASSWSLTSLQCLVLTAIYFAQCSRNLEYWRTAILSCTLCHNLLKNNTRWDTNESDQLSRCYWMCLLLERGPTRDRNVDGGDIITFKVSVPLPQQPSPIVLSRKDTEIFSQHCFLAQISLNLIIDRIVDSQKVYRKLFNSDDGDDGDDEMTSVNVTEELLSQLDNWRQNLPQELAWDDEAAAKESIELIRNGGWQNLQRSYMQITPDMKSILAASLQTRYKYALYTIWRPYIYRFLHYPGNLNDQDLQCCRTALNACLFWPITFPVFNGPRRLMPQIYDYCHPFFGILILMHLCESQQAAPQKSIVLSDPEMVYISNGMLLNWMRDMQAVHPVARWCWTILKNLYQDHQAVRD